MLSFAFRWWLVLSWMLIGFPLFAQEVAHEHFRIGKEAPFNSVYGHIAQDDQGYLWLGTDRGLYSYNGQHFKHYPVAAGIKDQEILSYDFGDGDTLWAYNLSKQLLYLAPGAAQLRLETGYNQVLKKHFTSQDFRCGFIQLGYRVPDGTFMLKKIINVLPSQFSKLEEIVGQLENWKFESAMCTSNGDLYLLQRLSKKFIYQLSYIRDGEPFIMDTVRYRRKVYPIISSLDNINKIVIHPDRAFITSPVYICNEAPPYQCRSIEVSSFDFSILHNIQNDPSGNIWFCTNKGAWRLPPEGSASQYLSHTVANNILKDQEGNHWIGTEKDGLYVIPDLNTTVYNARNSPLSNDNILMMTKGDGEGFFACTFTNQIFKVDTTGFALLHTLSSSSNDHQYIGSIKYYEGSLYITARPSNLLRYDLEKKTLSLVGSAISITNSADFYPGFFLTGGSQTHLLDTNFSLTNRQLISRNRNTALSADTINKRVWIGEIDGLKYYDFQKNKLELFNSKGQGIPFFITDIEQGAPPIIWVATADQGVFGITKDSILYHLTEKEGLLSNNCQQLMADGDQYLWIAGKGGISQLDLRSFAVQIIDRKNGLLTEEISDLHRTGEHLWVGSPQGLFRLPVRTNYTRSYPPKIEITKFKIWDRDTLLHNHYVLSHTQNNLQIEFQSIYLSDWSKLKYQYRMLGINDQWIEIDSRINFARFPQCQPGQYQFEVRAVNGTDLQSATATIGLEIQAADWQAWWFNLVLFLLLLTVSTLILYRIKRRQEKENQYKRKVEKFRSEALRAQMNPHFVFNTLNAIQNFVNKNKPQESVKYLSKFSKLIRSIFDHSKYDKIPLSEEILFLENYLELEGLRFADRVRIQIQIDPSLRDSSILIPPLLVQPLIENAFKHGLFHKEAPGTFQLSIKKRENHIEIIIEDDGIGRLKANAINQQQINNRSHSSGSILRERIAYLNQKRPPDQPKIKLNILDLMDKNDVPCGTRCQLFLYT